MNASEKLSFLVATLGLELLCDVDIYQLADLTPDYLIELINRNGAAHTKQLIKSRKLDTAGHRHLLPLDKQFEMSRQQIHILAAAFQEAKRELPQDVDRITQTWNAFTAACEHDRELRRVRPQDLTDAICGVKLGQSVVKVPRTINLVVPACPIPLLPLENPNRVDCFFNAVVQLLRAVPAFKEFFLSAYHQYKSTDLNLTSPLCWSRDLGKLISQENLGEDAHLSVADMRRSAYFPRGLRTGQQDAHELLLYVLDLPNARDTAVETLADRFFNFDWVVERLCLTCGLVGHRDDRPFTYLNLPLRSGPTDFGVLIETHYPALGRRAEFDDWKCPHCARAANAVNKKGVPTAAAPMRRYAESEFWSFDINPYLLIKLDFFHRTGQRDKSAYIIGFNADSLLFGGHHWKAIGTIIHTGDTPHSGHYYSYVRLSDAHAWWSFNDAASPRIVEFEAGLRNHSLILFEKITDS